MTRCFLAFPVSSKTKEIILDIQEEIKKTNKKAPVKWTGIDSFHITIEFLGDLEDAQIEKVERILKEIIPFYPVFNYELSHIDVFPNWERPNVLVIKAFNKEKIGCLLYSIIHKALKKEKFILGSRPWHPHITLGRVKGRFKPRDLKKIKIPRESWQINKIVFYKSKLSQAGSIYTPIDEYGLT